ncbi:hypothetical protein FKP32DRAFT_1167347 [Trametes sanguinea]|nr:hypothetical protein FKP32DRAFT_1167347 [Trametes sanguinea]
MPSECGDDREDPTVIELQTRSRPRERDSDEQRQTMHEGMARCKHRVVVDVVQAIALPPVPPPLTPSAYLHRMQRWWALPSSGEAAAWSRSSSHRSLSPSLSLCPRCTATPVCPHSLPHSNSPLALSLPVRAFPLISRSLPALRLPSAGPPARLLRRPAEQHTARHRLISGRRAAGEPLDRRGRTDGLW